MQNDVGQRIPMLGAWRFRPDPQDVGLERKWYADSATSENWTAVQVPDPWDPITSERHAGAGWFRRTFELPEPVAGRWGIGLVASADGCQVWVNGARMTIDDRAYRRFAFNINGVARPGTNTICVRAVDHGRGGGLIRSAQAGRYESIEELLQGPCHGQPARKSVDWVRDAVIYEVYLRSASQEGTLAGLEQRLSELRQMGVTVLWLMPIHPVGKERRKGRLGCPYAVRDYYGVNPEFGTAREFKSLVTAAHRRRMKVIIDLVANHTAWDCNLLQRHPDWYRCDQHGRVRTPIPDWSDVAQLDFGQPGLRRYMTDMLLHWVGKVGIDGFRCDVAGMVPLDYWVEARRELDQIKPIMLLAEDDSPAQHVEAFDLTYDFATYCDLEPLAAGTMTVDDFAGLLDEERHDFPTSSLRMRYSSNHDMCAWHKPAMTRYGPEGVETAAVLSFVLPGVPMIYTGQEIGNTTELDLFDRVSIDWDANDHGLREFYTRLAKLRRGRTSLRNGSLELVRPGGDNQVLGLVRQAPEEETYALVNLSKTAKTVSLRGTIPWSAKTLLASSSVERNDPARSLRLPPLAYWIGG